jgi:hypothetical protein
MKIFLTHLKEAWQNYLLIASIITVSWEGYQWLEKGIKRVDSIQESVSIQESKLSKEIRLRQIQNAHDYVYMKSIEDPHQDSTLSYKIPPEDTLLYIVKRKR